MLNFNTAISRRRFVGTMLAGAAALRMSSVPLSGSPGPTPRKFNLWAIGDAHVGSDHRRHRESLADAIRQSETGAMPFDWDIALNVGDNSGGQFAPGDDEGREVVKQYGAATKHRREHFYDLAGNHDASGPDEPTQWWFKKWVDPIGESTAFSGVDPARRPYPVTGTWERYSFRAGNLLFLVMSDRNDGGPPVGRGAKGGYPAGAVTDETFDWWRQQVEANRDSIIITAHHHMLRETTVGSGDWEGVIRKPDGSLEPHYHGVSGESEGASYLYYVGGKAKAMKFENYLAANPGAIDFWIGGHTHTHADDAVNGRTHIEQRWGATFINCCTLSRFHGIRPVPPMSRLLEFKEGATEATIRCYLHTSDHAPQGWYEKAQRTARLSKPFQAPVPPVG